MRHFLSCIVLGTIVTVGAGPAFGQGPSRDEVRKLEADLARLQAQLKAYESRSEPKVKAAKPLAPSATKGTAKRPGGSGAAQTRGPAATAPRGMAFNWQRGRFAPQAAQRGPSGWAGRRPMQMAGRGHGGPAMGRGGFAMGRGGPTMGRGGFAMGRGHSFTAPRGHMTGGARGFSFSMQGRMPSAGGRSAGPAAKTPSRGAPRQVAALVVLRRALAALAPIRGRNPLPVAKPRVPPKPARPMPTVDSSVSSRRSRISAQT